MEKVGVLKGKTAIVASSSRGIGWEIALTLVESGADLVINGDNQEQLEHVKAQVETLGSRCRIVRGDIPDNSTVARLAAACIEAFRKIDILVNNAGVNSRIPSLELTEEEWRRMMGANLDGVFYCCKTVPPHMVHQQLGAIISMSSTVSKTAHANAFICCGAPKAAVNSMVQRLAYETEPHHIRVDGICPGPTETGMSLQRAEEYRKNITKKISLGPLGTTKNVVDVAASLASDMTGFINGKTVNVNGGSYMN